ncbi:hypothetical protein AB0C76_33055 [Kitasatospora sp. NPDC048722]|uniref:hypothetical protein n=1 Tax=Kitasatospora sp. NPDC048722 TaxID=3155639 RepID=UPI0033FC2A14
MSETTETGIPVFDAKLPTDRPVGGPTVKRILDAFPTFLTAATGVRHEDTPTRNSLRQALDDAAAELERQATALRWAARCVDIGAVFVHSDYIDTRAGEQMLSSALAWVLQAQQVGGAR